MRKPPAPPPTRFAPTPPAQAKPGAAPRGGQATATARFKSVQTARVPSRPGAPAPPPTRYGSPTSGTPPVPRLGKIGQQGTKFNEGVRKAVQARFQVGISV